MSGLRRQSIDLMSGERLVRIDRPPVRISAVPDALGAVQVPFCGAGLARTWADLRPHRSWMRGAICRPTFWLRNAKGASTLSGLLSRNEVTRDYAYNRHLFARLAQGWYQFNLGVGGTAPGCVGRVVGTHSMKR